MLLQCGNNFSQSGCFLPDGYIHTDDVFALLVQNCVHSDGRFAGLTVADDQLSLSPSDRKHRVNGKDSCLQRNVYGFSVDDSRRFSLNREIRVSPDRSVTINGSAQRIDHAPDQSVPDRYSGTLAASNDFGAFDQPVITSQQHTADGLHFQILHNTSGTVLKLYQFPVHRMI